LQKESNNTNLKKALDDRMTHSEAMKVAAKLLELFPSAKNDISDGFIGGIAAILSDYPRQTALKSIHPKNGLAGEAVFISIAGLVAWCERQTEPLRQHVDRELRVERQIQEVNEWRGKTSSERLKEKGQAWLDRTDPIAQQISGENGKGKLAKDARDRIINEYGREKFEGVPYASVNQFI
jgi:hypothetical protein